MKGLIHLCYRKLIDASSQKAWDKFVFDDTHLEFYMKAQYFDPKGKHKTLQELVTNVPNASQIHGMVSTAAVGYLRQLNDIVPDITNPYGKLCLPFKRFKFEIIHSHIHRKAEHKVTIYFYSEPLTWIDTIGHQLLVAYGDQREALANGEEVETDLITLQPFLNISSVRNQ
ncbi:hypothetical protein [Runella slithyformis]|uniref:Uncharacterized protein n=1 Tax=Runella slithyformis (strain ATCC 29530 / DSM 19594 / LMG 11500 / NCIMB 11436 / LSU 4) TaxID=761193 RepID=A0A7U3ZKX6_RUNSL|nr:hypothetical protein [Runella slithyformis]AEI49103.1 hypothetical protein Runsl_2705 [Runella slithyformis DSM 19594]